ncbi:ArsR/SmtB family transcription factor [Meridianimarinicoccus sp. RP-17]|uniref:ArsR/SmtB family transcription factor n=1 Tax=Meridianimarinicoccus zhengii TaxID=2056810 RepID=UPI000DAC799D|nr:metalloregulator ArsR/SmtB family transcription factor [Phycocomes zhengii]
MDKLFKALGDPARREILDALRARDGQTLGDLATRFEMTRFGVMKHLGVLEDAGLITTLRRGRFKYHYLNAVPLQQAIDRWIEPLIAKPAARALIELKSTLEGDQTMHDTDAKPDFVLQTFIRCSQDALWDALTRADQMAAWHFMAHRVDREGDCFDYRFADGSLMLRSRAIEITPKTRIVATFEPQWEGGGAPSRTVFRIAAEGDHCSLTVEHYGLTFPVLPGEGVSDGWARWAAGLKTWLETGEAVRFAHVSDGGAA